MSFLERPSITLHVDLGLHWRGGQSQALLLIQGLMAQGHTAELVAVRDSPLAQRAQGAGVRVHAVRPEGRRLRATFRLQRLLSQRRWDVVHCHEAHALTAAWLAGAHRCSRVVASRRVAYPLSRSPFGLARYRSTSRVVAVSRFVRDSVLASGLPPEKVAVIYDGVRLPALPAAVTCTGDSPVVGCVGYLLPEKGQEALIRALPLIRDEVRDCRLTLAGEGPCRAPLERLAQKLDLGEAVRFTGLVGDVAQVYRSLHVFLFPSLAEPLGSSLLAAMSHALPVVAVARGAVPEVIEDGRNGLLVAESDAGSIARATLRLLGDPALAARLGAAARQTIAQRFTADAMVQATLCIYFGDRLRNPENR